MSLPPAPPPVLQCVVDIVSLIRVPHPLCMCVCIPSSLYAEISCQRCFPYHPQWNPHADIFRKVCTTLWLFLRTCIRVCVSVYSRAHAPPSLPQIGSRQKNVCIVNACDHSMFPGGGCVHVAGGGSECACSGGRSECAWASTAGCRRCISTPHTAVGARYQGLSFAMVNRSGGGRRCGDNSSFLQVSCFVPHLLDPAVRGGERG